MSVGLPQSHTVSRQEPTHFTGQTGLTPPKRRKRGLVWVVLLLVIAVIVGYAVWRASKPQAPATAATGRGGRGRGAGATGPIPVVVTTAGRASVPVVLNGLGNVTAFYTDTVTSRVDGQIMKVDFTEGELVKAGQVLFEVDPRPYQVQLEQAEGALAHDQAILTGAQIDLDRYKTAYSRNAIAKQQLDDQQQTVFQDQGTVKQDQANVDNAKLQLTYANVTAPITGVAGLRLVDPGNMVHGASGTSLVVITQLQPITVLFTIPEDSLPPVVQKLRAGAHLPVDAYNRDDSKKLASGTLMTLDNQIDSTTGTSKLKAVFDNKDNALFPQQFVNIHLLVDTLQNQLVVPNVAVQNGQQGTFVYAVDDNSRVHLKPVQVGIATDKVTDILGGLADTDRIVIDGTDRLVEGSQVRVRRPGESESTPPGTGGGRGRRSGAAGAAGAGGGQASLDSGTGNGGPQGNGGQGNHAYGGNGDHSNGGGHRGNGQGHRGGGSDQ
ncbi:MAG TPA: MdtA/MuxA family multidrug efflux RND transporter periplasmic adaptor subunit [Candidatus Acidoferrales bacterium]